MKNVYLGNDIDIKSFLTKAKKNSITLKNIKIPQKGSLNCLLKVLSLVEFLVKWNMVQELLEIEASYAHPFNKNINDDLNKRLTRTEFMPFAPSVCKNKAEKYYEGAISAEYPGEFMTITLNVKKRGKLQKL